MSQREGKWYEPGIFRLRCIENNRAFFQESIEIFFDLTYLLEDLNNGVCSNKQLLDDYKKFGADKFEIECVAFGEEYQFQDKRIKALEQLKNSWPGDLY